MRYSQIDPLDTQPLFYQYRTSPLLYHTANQRYNNTSPTMVSSSPNQSAKASVAKLCEALQVEDALEACPVTTFRNQGFYQTVLPLGKSPPSRYTQGCRAETGCETLKQINPRRDDHEATERTTVKQENISYSYLEDGEKKQDKVVS